MTLFAYPLDLDTYIVPLMYPSDVHIKIKLLQVTQRIHSLIRELNITSWHAKRYCRISWLKKCIASIKYRSHVARLKTNFLCSIGWKKKGKQSCVEMVVKLLKLLKMVCCIPSCTLHLQLRATSHTRRCLMRGLMWSRFQIGRLYLTRTPLGLWLRTDMEKTCVKMRLNYSKKKIENNYRCDEGLGSHSWIV